MGDAYPEVKEHRARVAETVRSEEERFAETLDLGMAKIREYLLRGGFLVTDRMLGMFKGKKELPANKAKELTK